MKEEYILKLKKENEEYIIGVFTKNEADFIKKNIKQFLKNNVKILSIKIKNKN